MNCNNEQQYDVTYISEAFFNVMLPFSYTEDSSQLEMYENNYFSESKSLSG